jgi:serine/threonine protein kinase
MCNVIAPELLVGTIEHRRAWASTASDIFALGCVFYEIETGKLPYQDYPAAGTSHATSLPSFPFFPYSLLSCAFTIHFSSS